MKENTLNLLHCPKCKSKQLNIDNPIKENNDITSCNVICENGHSYSCKNGILDLIFESTENSKLYDLMWASYGEKAKVRSNVPDSLFSKYIDTNLIKICTNSLVLDVGCGKGDYSRAIYDLGASQVVGIDFSYEALLNAKKNTDPTLNIDFVRCDINNLPFNASFDFVYSYWVLHHLENTKRGFNNILNALKENGFINICVFKKGTLPFWTNMVRKFSLKCDIKKVESFCNKFGFNENKDNIPDLPIGNFFRKLGYFDFLKIGSINFEVLTTPWCHTHVPSEVRQWFSEASLEVISIKEYPGISIVGKK